MNINYAFRGFEENSEGLKDYASKKLGKVDKLVSANTLIEVIFQKDKNLKFTEIKLNHEGEDFIARYSDEKEFSASIDLCVDKLTKQIKKAKDRKVDKRRS
ncbi:MAG TPA: HPF/RaiA family ribosome-associated protein [bacterium]|nr:HPF/RaiA family ribosome-associated protein [bacterium]